MTDFSYQRPLGGTAQFGCSGYILDTPKAPKNTFRYYILALLAVVGLILAAIGLVFSLITTAAWASGILVVGLGAFCLAGYLARHGDLMHRQSATTWRPI